MGRRLILAERFGGRFSPTDGDRPRPSDAPRPYRGKRRSRAGGRVNLLFVAPIPLILFAFGQDPTGLALNLGGAGLLFGGAWMTREGILAQEAYEARKVAKRPAIPRKIFGSVLTGLGLAVAALDGGSAVAPAIFAVLGGGLHLFSFGPDPLRDKGSHGVDSFQSDRVARVVDEAEGYLTSMRTAIERAGDRALEARVDRFAATARETCRAVEEDPRDLTAARRYLGVYLLGARDATVKYADLAERGGTPGARKDYLALLDDLEENFAAKNRKLLLEDRSDLDVEIGVLRDRLAREGVALE